MSDEDFHSDGRWRRPEPVPLYESRVNLLASALFALIGSGIVAALDEDPSRSAAQYSWLFAVVAAAFAVVAVRQAAFGWKLLRVRTTTALAVTIGISALAGALTTGIALTAGYPAFHLIGRFILSVLCFSSSYFAWQTRAGVFVREKSDSGLHCLSCGYDLRAAIADATDPRNPILACPECGHESDNYRRPTVSPAAR